MSELSFAPRGIGVLRTDVNEHAWETPVLTLGLTLAPLVPISAPDVGSRAHDCPHHTPTARLCRLFRGQTRVRASRPVRHTASGPNSHIGRGHARSEPSNYRRLASDPSVPVEGGSANDYDYMGGDPVNNFDLAGMRCWTGRIPTGRAAGLARGLDDNRWKIAGLAASGVFRRLRWCRDCRLPGGRRNPRRGRNSSGRVRSVQAPAIVARGAPPALTWTTPSTMSPAVLPPAVFRQSCPQHRLLVAARGSSPGRSGMVADVAGTCRRDTAILVVVASSPE
jgi:hypothetical protein